MKEPPPSVTEDGGDVTPELVNITLGEMLDAGPDIEMATLEDDGFLRSIRDGYAEDILFKLVVVSPDEYKQFTMEDGLIFTHNCSGVDVVCVPRTNHGTQSL